MSAPSIGRPGAVPAADALDVVKITDDGGFPPGTDRTAFVSFLHTHLGPYGDPPEAIDQAIDYAFSDAEGRGGFLLLAQVGHRPVGAMVVNDTGMAGYIPEHILVYVAVDAAARGRGIGTRLLDAMALHCDGDVALHVEPENPARRLYERFGFTSKYLEMRLHR